jgi:hypothetical protein
MAGIDDLERRLIAYIEASQEARGVLSTLYALDLTDMDIQTALAETLDIPGNPPLGVLDRNLTVSDIVQLLKSYDFKRLHPDVLAEVIVEEAMIPAHIPRLLTEKTVKIKGEVWRIHKSDADPFPSIPHAHNYETGVVLHLGTGEMYGRDRRLIGKLDCKKLLRLRAELSSFTLPSTTCT